MVNFEAEFLKAVKVIQVIANTHMEENYDESSPRAVLSAIDPFAIIDQKYPEIVKEACKFALACPVSQVSVERLFSCLLFMTPDRRNMDPETIDDLMFLRANEIYI